jgi:Transglycosylase SLT domain
MMATTSILAVPGIERVNQTFLGALAALADRNGWDVDGIAGVISHESRFDPAAHNPQPGQTATGLLQFIESTARQLGTTTAALRAMTALQQLPYVEKFFRATLRRAPGRPEDYLLATFGRADLIGDDDATVVDRADSDDPREAERYRVNSALDAAGKGFITVGDLRSSARASLNAAGGQRVRVTAVPVSSSSRSSRSSSGLELVALILLAWKVFS